MRTVVKDGRAALIGLYAPPAEIFVRGEGCWLEDADGRRYLDFTAGIAVCALGHGSPVVADAITDALGTGLVHVSNLFRTGPAERLAEELTAAAFESRAFFCNSGAEANEAAFKFARKWAREGADGPRPGKHEIVAFKGSFHGRLFGSLAATDRPTYREPFEPLMPGVRFASVDDPTTLDVIDADRTAAVIVEPIQGEGGVRPLPSTFLTDLRARCDEAGAALILDEIQCGLGRTGDLFAYQASGITPDILTLAKPLAGGLPMGAVLAAPHVAGVLAPGDHGTTFGGGPLVASVARAVLAEVGDAAFLAGVRARGARLEAGLRGLVTSFPSRVKACRGRGLMWGLELHGSAAPVVGAARERGLLVCSAGPDVIRLVPPLVVSDAEIDRALELLAEVVA